METLLLQGLDSLRQVGEHYRQGEDINTDWLNHQIHPIFDQLQTHLGNVTDEDENALLSEDEGEIDPALLMFEDGVDAVLDRIEAQCDTLSGSRLAQELATTAEELIAFGHMAALDPFIQLCQSIQQLAQQVSPAQAADLSQDAVKTWRRSHALVLRRRFEKLPSQLDGFTLIPAASSDVSLSPLTDNRDVLTVALSSAELPAPTTAVDEQAPPTANSFDAPDLSDPAVAEWANALVQELPAEEIPAAPNPDLFAAVGDINDQLLSELQDAFAVESEAEVTPNILLTVEQAARALQKATTPQGPATVTKPQTTSGKTVRVPVEQLEQFNTLFGKLILERNTVNLRLEQLQTFTALMRQRMRQLEQSNTQLQQWYDRASLEGIVPTEGLPSPVASQIVNGTATSGRFDALEMDRYTDLHLLAQEQIETIVQLQEVNTDIDLTLQDMDQAVRGLNQTTRSLQGNITRTQMLPFAEVVKRFPRLIRDLSVQYDKPVRLKLEGENTLIDRAALEALADPLNHLLRNAFDSRY